MSDAYQQNSVLELTNVLTWALAGIAYDFGSLGMADILGRLGGHLQRINENQVAQAEAESAKRKGIRPQ